MPVRVSLTQICPVQHWIPASAGMTLILCGSPIGGGSLAVPLRISLTQICPVQQWIPASAGMTGARQPGLNCRFSGGR